MMWQRGPGVQEPAGRLPRDQDKSMSGGTLGLVLGTRKSRFNAEPRLRRKLRWVSALATAFECMAEQGRGPEFRRRGWSYRV